MSTTEASSNDASGTASVRNVDMTLEVVLIPVSDVDRAKEFYLSLGWRLDADVAAGDDFRLVQFTPPGAGCSIQFGTNLTSAAPGSAQGMYLIVSGIEAARDELVARGVEVSEVFHEGTPGARFHDAGRVAGPSARAQQLRLVRLVQRPGRQRLAVPGGHDAAARPCRPGYDVLHVGERPGGRASAGVGRPRRAREAHRRRPTRTGPTGTPSTWCASGPATNCRHDRRRRFVCSFGCYNPRNCRQSSCQTGGRG